MATLEVARAFASDRYHKPRNGRVLMGALIMEQQCVLRNEINHIDDETAEMLVDFLNEWGAVLVNEVIILHSVSFEARLHMGRMCRASWFQVLGLTTVRLQELFEATHDDNIFGLMLAPVLRTFGKLSCLRGYRLERTVRIQCQAEFQIWEGA
jgi:hypothetical protein